MRTPFTEPPLAPQRRHPVRHASAELARVAVMGGDDLPIGARGLLADRMRWADASAHANEADGEWCQTGRDRLRAALAQAPRYELDIRSDAPATRAPVSTRAAAAPRSPGGQFGRMLDVLRCALSG